MINALKLFFTIIAFLLLFFSIAILLVEVPRRLIKQEQEQNSTKIIFPNAFDTI